MILLGSFLLSLAFHPAVDSLGFGIEVILDVVFNHTAEGTWGEKNWHSLAEIAKSKYYILNKGALWYRPGGCREPQQETIAQAKRHKIRIIEQTSIVLLS